MIVGWIARPRTIHYSFGPSQVLHQNGTDIKHAAVCPYQRCNMLLVFASLFFICKVFAMCSGLSNSLKRPWKLDVEDGNCNMGSPGRSTEILSKGLALEELQLFDLDFQLSTQTVNYLPFRNIRRFSTKNETAPRPALTAQHLSDCTGT